MERGRKSSLLINKGGDRSWQFYSTAICWCCPSPASSTDGPRRGFQEKFLPEHRTATVDVMAPYHVTLAERTMDSPFCCDFSSSRKSVSNLFIEIILRVGACPRMLAHVGACRFFIISAIAALPAKTRATTLP